MRTIKNSSPGVPSSPKQVHRDTWKPLKLPVRSNTSSTTINSGPSRPQDGPYDQILTHPAMREKPSLNPKPSLTGSLKTSQMYSDFYFTGESLSPLLSDPDITPPLPPAHPSALQRRPPGPPRSVSLETLRRANLRGQGASAIPTSSGATGATSRPTIPKPDMRLSTTATGNSWDKWQSR